MGPMHADIRAVLFDRDDTLSLTDAGVYRLAAQWAAERYGLDPREAARAMQAQWASVEGRWQHLRSLEDEEAFWEVYGTELAGRLGLGPEEGRPLVEAYPYWKFLVPAPGARAVLTELRRRGLKIGVLSNTLPNVAVTLEAVGLADLVDVALSSCTLGVHKPEPEVFRLAAGRLGLPPGQILFVDDLPANVAAARAVGMQAVLIDHAGAAPEAIHTLDALLEAERRTA